MLENIKGTLGIDKKSIASKLVKDRGYNITEPELLVVIDNVMKNSEEKLDAEELASKVSKVLDSMGVKKEAAVEFNGRFYIDEKLKECISIAKVETNVKDPDPLINFLRSLIRDLNMSGEELTLESAKAYIKAYEDLKKQADMEKKEGISR